jgi:TetR/AcrR family transcriptional regulator, ethionamide resistance regulator
MRPNCDDLPPFFSPILMRFIRLCAADFETACREEGAAHAIGCRSGPAASASSQQELLKIDSAFNFIILELVGFRYIRILLDFADRQARVLLKNELSRVQTTLNKLATKSDEAPKRRNWTKGTRTRRALLDATRRLLERDGFHALKVSEIAPEAGLSPGIFYTYFEDKNQISLEIFREVVAEDEATIYAQSGPTDPFDAVLQHMRLYVQQMLNEGALPKALQQMLDALPEARAIWHEYSARIARRIASGLEKRAPGAVADEAARIIYAHAAQAMSDTMLINIKSYKHADYEPIAGDTERISQVLSVIWFRMLYGKTPPAEKCPLALGFLPAPDWS